MLFLACERGRCLGSSMDCYQSVRCLVHCTLTNEFILQVVAFPVLYMYISNASDYYVVSRP